MNLYLVDHAEDPSAAPTVVARAKNAKAAAAAGVEWHRSQMDARYAPEMDQIWPKGCLTATELLMPASGVTMWEAGDGQGSVCPIDEGAEVGPLPEDARLWLALPWNGEDDGMPDLLLVADSSEQALAMARDAYPEATWTNVMQLLAYDDEPVTELPRLA